MASPTSTSSSSPAAPQGWWHHGMVVRWRFLLLSLLVLLTGDMLMRLVFLAYNMNGGWEFEGKDVPMALLRGVRFDLATVAMVHGLVLIAAALPLAGAPRFLRASAWINALLHLPVIFVNAVDVVYFGFASKRLSHEFFSGGSEAANFGVAEFLPYWWLILLVFVFAGGQFWLLRRFARKVQPWRPAGLRTKLLAWSLPVVVAGLLFLAFRGGLQTRPLRPANAFVTSSLFLGNLSLNSAYTIAQSMEIGNEEAAKLMPMPEAIALSRALVRNDFDGPWESEEYPLLRTTQFAEPERRYNVVLLIVESLNAGKLGCIRGAAPEQSLTPHMDALARRGRLYTNFYSNGARSVQSLPAILNSTPDIFERPLIGSSFETNQQWGIGSILARRSYHTSFVCGGPNGTMGFDSFSKVSGFDHYYGRSDYAGPSPEIAGNWGLHDKPVLDWLVELQESFPKPFLSTWFSISNHHPFALPADCPPEIAQRNISPMDKTVMYTDWAIGKYFEQVNKTEWAQNTIFLITGDHCFYFEDDPDRGDVQNVNVPLIMLGPEIVPGVDDRVGSHISILPTLIEMLRLRTRYAGVGVSLLSKQNEPFGITGLMGIETLVRKHQYYSTTFEKALNCHHFLEGKWIQDNSFATTAEGLAMEQSLRAIYQVCSHMRRYNKQNLPRGMAEGAP